MTRTNTLAAALTALLALPALLAPNPLYGQ